MPPSLHAITRSGRPLDPQRRHFLKVAAGTTGLLLTAGCSATPLTSVAAGEPPAQATPQSAPTNASFPPASGLLRIALAVAPDQLDPALFAVIEAYPLGFAVYDALTWVDSALSPQPQLAEAWAADEGGRSWTFHLRKNVTFHHGSPLTAEDVVYTFQRLLDPDLGSVLQPILSFLDGVTAVDEHTVRFHLKTPNVDLPILLAAPQARIVAHDYDPTMLATKPSGTGPFLFTEAIANERLRFTRNPDYWDGAQIFIEELQHVYIADFAEQAAALQRGEVDLLLDIGLQGQRLLAADPAITIQATGYGRYQNIAMRVSEPPFTDQRVRQALKHCVDRARLVQDILQGHGQVGNDQPVAPIHPDWAALSPPAYNPTKAKQLLDEAGYVTGLQLDLITAAAAPSMIELAYALQAMVKPAGIELRVVEVKTDANVYFDEYWSRAPFYVSAWEFRPSVDETLMSGYHSQAIWNETGWSSAACDALIETARSEADPVKRKTHYAQVQALIAEEGAVIIPYFQPVITAAHQRVQGFTPHPAGWLDLRNVRVQ